MRAVALLVLLVMLACTACPPANVFQIDILACAKCGGRMKVLAVIDQPDVVTKILGHLGMPTVPEGIAPARLPKRQLDFDLDAA